jgi:P27 family predicted phage terminase small subunit
MSEEIIKPRTGKLSGVLKIAPASYVEPGRPKRPRDLSPSQKRTFKRVCGALEKRRTLSPGDFDIVMNYVRLDARREEAQRVLDDEGAVIQTADGPRTNPALAIVERTEAKLLTILRDLGLTPASRDKVKVTRRVAEPDLFEITLNPEPPKKEEEPPCQPSNGKIE